MTAVSALVIAAGFLLAFVNGANDVSKGIATLVGSGMTGYRRAIRWGAAWTALGAFAGASVAGAMLATFDKGFLSSDTVQVLPAAGATICGAIAWVLFATWRGLPVSTTHAIVGAVAGSAVAAYGMDAVSWGAIGGRIALPLLLSPAVAFGLTWVLFRAGRAVTTTPSGIADCICAETDLVPGALIPAPTVTGVFEAAMPAAARTRLAFAPSEDCKERDASSLRVTAGHLHWLTSGATSFARGLNDGPKIVALLLAAAALSPEARLGQPLLFGVVTVAMFAGSLLGGRRVTRLLAERVTRMDHHEGFGANLVTSVLVCAGALGGLPMSTTHVSSSAIIAAGVQRGAGGVRWSTVRDMALAWCVTLPAAAALGWLGVRILS